MLRTEDAKIGSISRLVFGCASVGGRVSERASKRAMAAALDAGVTTFDVARSYGYGEAERILGDFLRGRRSRVEIITKAGIVAPRPSIALRVAKAAARQVFALLPRARQLARPTLGGQHSGGHFEPRELERSLAASLSALRTDYVDALLLHACTVEVVMRDDIRETMSSFVRRGLARRVGVASGAREATLWFERGCDPAAELPATELRALSRPGPAGLLLANQPLGGGPLLERVERACDEHGFDRRRALEFLLERPLAQGASAVVISMLSPSHVEAALSALERRQLSADERQKLERVLEETG